VALLKPDLKPTLGPKSLYFQCNRLQNFESDCRLLRDEPVDRSPAIVHRVIVLDLESKPCGQRDRLRFSVRTGFYGNSGRNLLAESEKMNSGILLRGNRDDRNRFRAGSKEPVYELA